MTVVGDVEQLESSAAAKAAIVHFIARTGGFPEVRLMLNSATAADESIRR